MNQQQPYAKRYHQRGISLVELMIAILLGLILMAGVLQLFSSNKATYSNMEGISEIQDGGRAGMERLKAQIRMAGYMGCSSVNNIDPNNKTTGAAAVAFDSSVVIAGQDNVATAGIVAGTDVLTVTTATSADTRMNADLASVTSDIVITDNPNNFQMDDTLILTDCERADIFNISDISAGPAPFTIKHQQNNTGSPSVQVNANNSLSTPYLADDSLLLSLSSVTYSVRPTPRTDANGNPVLSLFETRGGTTTEVITGVEDMQILYGVDNSADLVADEYVAAGGIPTGGGGNWSDVVSVRISLLISTEQGIGRNPRPFTDLGGNPVPNPGDNRMRRTFTTTIGLRNRSI